MSPCAIENKVLVYRLISRCHDAHTGLAPESSLPMLLSLLGSESVVCMGEQLEGDSFPEWHAIRQPRPLALLSVCLNPQIGVHFEDVRSVGHSHDMI